MSDDTRPATIADLRRAFEAMRDSYDYLGQGFTVSGAQAALASLPSSEPAGCKEFVCDTDETTDWCCRALECTCKNCGQPYSKCVARLDALSEPVDGLPVVGHVIYAEDGSPTYRERDFEEGGEGVVLASIANQIINQQKAEIETLRGRLEDALRAAGATVNARLIEMAAKERNEWKTRAEQAESALASARSDAMREAAKICDEQARLARVPIEMGSEPTTLQKYDPREAKAQALEVCAAQIRAAIVESSSGKVL